MMCDLSPLSGEERKLDFGTIRSVDGPIAGMAISKDISLPTGTDVFRMPSLESYNAAF